MCGTNQQNQTKIFPRTLKYILLDTDFTLKHDKSQIQKICVYDFYKMPVKHDCYRKFSLFN